MSQISIRNARSSDIPQVREIELATFLPAETFSYGFLHLMTTHARPFLVAHNTHNELLGYILAIPQDEFAHIISIAVKPSYQGQGIGTKLLTAMIDFMQNKNYKCFRLELRKSNERARKLYYNFNFRIIGTRKNYYFDGEDAVVMELIL